MPEISRVDRDEEMGAADRQVASARAASDESKGGINLGERLRQMRANRRLTLQKASDLTGVSASAFSKIERNELSPTISTLQRIAEGLGVELVSLLAEEYRVPITTGGGRRSVSRAGDGYRHSTDTCHNFILCADLKDKRATPVLTTVNARSTEEYKTWAMSDAEIFLMVLEGVLVVHSRTYEPLELNKGDSVYYDATTEHTWTSKGTEDAVVLWVLINRDDPAVSDRFLAAVR